MPEQSKIQREIVVKLQVLGIHGFNPYSTDLKLIISELSKAITSTSLFYKIAGPLAVISIMICILLSIGLITGKTWLPPQGLAGLYIASIALLLIAVRFNLRIEKMESQLFLVKLLQQSINEQKNTNDEYK